MSKVESDPGLLDLSYGEALLELDQILAELESSAVDVDVLAERVSRGAVLVRYCRDRLHTVRVDVEAVVGDLLEEASTATARSSSNGAAPDEAPDRTATETAHEMGDAMGCATDDDGPGA